MDPGVRQTGGTEVSIPMPASIHTVDQPKATLNAAPAPPKTENPNSEPQPNDPVTQESPSSQRNGGHKGGNVPQHSGDPQQASGSKVGSGNSGNSGQEADPKPNSDPNQVDSNQGSDQNVDPVPQKGPTQTDNAYPGQTTIINNQVVQPLPYGISIAGTTLIPEAPPITVSGTPIYYASSALVIGISTVPLTPGNPTSITTAIGGEVITVSPSEIIIAGTALMPGALGVIVGGTLVSLNTAGQLIVGSETTALRSGGTGLGGLVMAGLGSEIADPITTIIDGHVITANPTALTMAGTTLTSGAPGVTIDGTLVSLNTAAQLVVESKTIRLESEATAGLGGAIMGGYGAVGPFGPFSTILPLATQGGFSTGAGNGSSKDVQVFIGHGVRLKGCALWNKMAVGVIAVAGLAYIC